MTIAALKAENKRLRDRVWYLWEFAFVRCRDRSAYAGEVIVTAVCDPETGKRRTKRQLRAAFEATLKNLGP